VSLYNFAISVSGFALAYISTMNPWFAFATIMATTYASNLAQHLISFEAAEAFAIENASYEQLAGGIRYLTAIKNVRLIFAKTFNVPGKKALNLSDGSNFVFTPYISKRIVRIKGEMQRREKKESRNAVRNMPTSLESNARVHKIEKVIQTGLKGMEKYFLSLH